MLLLIIFCCGFALYTFFNWEQCKMGLNRFLYGKDYHTCKALLNLPEESFTLDDEKFRMTGRCKFLVKEFPELYIRFSYTDKDVMIYRIDDSVERCPNQSLRIALYLKLTSYLPNLLSDFWVTYSEGMSRLKPNK